MRQYKVIKVKEPNGKLEQHFYTRLKSIADNQNNPVFSLPRPMLEMVQDACHEAITWKNKYNKKGSCDLKCYGDENEVIIHRITDKSDVLYKVIRT